MALAAGLVSLGLLAAGCGSGSKAPSVASVGTAKTATPASPPHSARQSAILFDSCIRAHGVANFPDSAVSAIGNQVTLHVPGYLKGEPQFQAALQACRKDLLGGSRPATKHVNTQEQLKFAECMRSHGITDFPDPMAGGGWDLPGDTDSPQFDAAAHACQTTGIDWNGPP